MSKEISVEDKLLLELLSEELRGTQNGEKHAGVNWQQLFARADRHRVLALLYNRIDTEATVETKQTWLAKSKSAVLQSYHLLLTAKYVVELLEENQIPCVLLKGVTIANCYPVPELRKSGDVDVLLLDPKQKKQTEELLLKAGFSKSSEQHGSHHTVWYSPERIEAEIHTRLVELFTDDAANKTMDKQFAEISGQICRKNIMGVEFPVLREGFQAYHLLLHMLVHYMHSGFGLRLLCDWVVFWNNPVEQGEKEIYLRLVTESGLQKFSDMITSLCVHFLGLAEPELGNTLFVEEAEEYLQEILEAEEFGTSDSDRLVVLQGTGIGAYIKEFHHQMKMNYPKAGKVWILWPVLWVCTLVRFVTNNHKLRRTSSWNILKKTHERSHKIKGLQLFQTK